MVTTTVLLLALKSLVVAAATLLLLRVTRARSAAERSTIAHLGLLALVALPLATLSLPLLALPMLTSIRQLAALTPVERTVVPLLHLAASSVTPVAVSPDPPSAFSRFASTFAHYAYLLPTLGLLALTLAALLRFVGLRARAEVLIDPDWLSALARAQRRMGFKSGTALLRSEELGSPVSWGLMRPTILLNEAAVLAPKQAEAIIAHELAHVVQLDWVKLILARVATAAFWFNPLAWVLAREAHQLREEAADDAVLAANIAGPDYAQLLIDVARHQCRGTLLGAHGVAPSKSSLGRRIRRVLDTTSARDRPELSWVAGFATAMLSMALPLAVLTIVPSDATPALADKRPNMIGMRPVRITTDYKRAMAEAGLPSVSVDDLTGARAAGLTPGYVRAMRTDGMRGSLDDLIGAKATGVEPDYIGSLRALGIDGSLEDFQSMRAAGVTPAFVRSLRARRINVTSPEKLIALLAADFDRGS